MNRDNSNTPENDLFRILTIAALLLGLFDFFLILLLWNVSGQKPNIDSLSVSLTVLEIFIAIIAVTGYWVFRQHAAAEARKEANAIAREVATPVARAVAYEFMSTYLPKNGNNTRAHDIEEMMSALDIDDE